MKLMILFVILLPAVISRQRDSAANCYEPMRQGSPCLSNIPMFYYDPQYKTCLQFYYKGCGGNNNRFNSRKECLSQCGEEESEDSNDLEDPEESENSNDLEDPEESENSNDLKDSEESEDSNDLEDSEESEDLRPGTEDVCTMPSAKGFCQNEIYRWYYDYENQECRVFAYSGCQGNGNNFQTQQECETTCL